MAKKPSKHLIWIKMAKEGLRFLQCYTGSPVCAPSRSVLMTGLHTGHTTVRGNTGIGGVTGLGGRPGRVPLNKEDITLAERLKALGYTTGMFGKWGLGEPGTSGEPNEQGFDVWFGYLNQRLAHDYYPDFLWENKNKLEFPENANNQDSIYSHDLIMDRAFQFIRDHQNKPFFAYLPLTIPHDKYQIPSTDPYTQQDWSDDEKVHAAMISRMDKDIGQLFSLLKKLKIDEKTIVFFCSDNGAARRWEGRFDSSGSLRGRKRDVYEGGLRTPMIVRWPGKVEENKVDSSTVWYFADVVPTLIEIAGDTLPKNLDGLSVWSSILDQSKKLPKRCLYWEFHEQGGKQAIRWNNWKLVRLAVQEKGFHREVELYNLFKDPGENQNLAETQPQLVEKLIHLMDKQRVPSKNFPFQFESN